MNEAVEAEEEIGGGTKRLEQLVALAGRDKAPWLTPGEYVATEDEALEEEQRRLQDQMER
ncbi:MAG TPA: hypothetical protein VKA48_11495 [Gammaproteobacteria bacterium]|nr:hypothetical protein [Gammaproteobacteria bacterium]